MKKMLRYALLALVIVPAASFVALPFVGLSPTELQANIEVGTGMGAKLACSGRYVTGLSDEQILADLASYSPAVKILDVEYDDAQQLAHVSLFGLSKTVARHRPGLGCTLEIGDTSPLDEINVPVLPASKQVWPRGEAATEIDVEVQARTDEILRRDNHAGLHTRGLVVIHEGRLTAESYGDTFSASTQFLGWSMGKSLTSIMLGHLEFTGKLSLAETNLFPVWSSDTRRDISVEHLLRMSSGLEFDETYAPGSDATRMLFAAHSASQVAVAKPVVFSPGAHFAYSSGTANLLAQLLVDRLGGTQGAVHFLVRRIFGPLGISHMTIEPDPSGVFVGSSYVYGTARDWARLGQLMLNGGELNGTRLVTPEWVARAVRPNVSDNEPRYGYQFWLNRGGDRLRWPALPADAYAMSGNRQQTVMVVPSKHAVLVRLGWTSGDYPMEQNFAELLAEL